MSKKYGQYFVSALNKIPATERAVGKSPIAPAQWESMGTAPKDGTPILGWDGRDIATCYWRTGLEYWSLCVAGAYAKHDDFEPKCWQRCPEGPK